MSRSKSVSFSRDSLCFIYFDVIICQRLKVKFKLVELFSRANEIKTGGLAQQLKLGMLSGDFHAHARDFQSPIGNAHFLFLCNPPPPPLLKKIRR